MNLNACMDMLNKNIMQKQSNHNKKLKFKTSDVKMMLYLSNRNTGKGG